MTVNQQFYNRVHENQRGLKQVQNPTILTKTLFVGKIQQLQHKPLSYIDTTVLG